jgi:hypothetical protein
MSYIHQPYPAHRYDANDAVRVVANADEDAVALAEGFVDHPSKVGQQTTVSAPHTMKTPKGGKKPATLAPEDPAPAPVKVVSAPKFDRTSAVATLEAAGYEIDKDVTDDELVEALAELAK